MFLPCGASGVGFRKATALMKREPARNVCAAEKEESDAFIHEIAVESREDDRIRSFEGATTALT